MDEKALAYEELLGKFVKWAHKEDDIRAAFILGSRARTDHPADEWSDLDVGIIANDPEPYLATTEWLKNIGNYWITFIETTATGGGQERRVLFEGWLDIDFVMIRFADFQQMIGVETLPPEYTDIMRRGTRIVIDKNNIFGRFQGIKIEPLAHSPPAEPEFLNVVNDFWYHAVWTTKKLRRGELWWAKSCCDAYMKNLLLRIMEWHAQAMQGEGADTWMHGRFLEEWADSRAVEKLPKIFARDNKKEIGQALLATIGLFRWLAIETARKWGYTYPEAGDKAAAELVEKLLAGEV
jgi:aminoglycoside 6-adenylyltransferase